MTLCTSTVTLVLVKVVVLVDRVGSVVASKSKRSSVTKLYISVLCVLVEFPVMETVLVDVAFGHRNVWLVGLSGSREMYDVLCTVRV